MSAQPGFHDQPPDRSHPIRVFVRYVRLHASALAEKIGRRIPKLRGVSRKKLLYLELFVGLPLLVLLLLAGRILFFLYLDPRGLPDIESLVNFQPLSIGEIQDSRGEVLVELAREYRRVVDYKDMPPVVVNAILAAEDKRFFRHHGVDYLALPRVALRTLTRTKQGLGFSQGGSTVTQQLVRVYFLPHLTSRENRDALLRRSLLARLTSLAIGPRATNKLIRKAEEIRISLWLERQMKRRFGSRRAAKEQILARYASVVYLGHGRHGFSAASEYYFGVPLSSYTAEDADKAALLAGLAKAPEVYAPSPDDMTAALTRRNTVLDMMVKDHFLERGVAERLKHKVPVLATHSDVKTEAPTVVGAVFDELKSLASAQVGVGSLISGHIRVRSTVDMRVQEIATEALERGISGYESRHPRASGTLQGAVVVMRNLDGAILAEVGGRQMYGKKRAVYTDYNRATDALRQPGSAMKPLVYLAAFQRGILSLDAEVPDEPISVSSGRKEPPKWIANYDRQFKGMIPARQALAESRNAVAVWLASQVGVRSVIATARALGFTSPLDPYLSLALGASEVRLVELANVYRAMASGILAAPHLVDVISDSEGRPIPVKRPEERVVNPMEYGLPAIQEGLRGVVRLPGGTAHSLDSADFPIPVMGKTGTTNDFRDALFVGSTYGPNGITVAVRLGFDDNRALGEKETGARMALPVFKEVMQKVYGRSLVGPVPPFPPEIENGIDSYVALAAQRAEEAELARQRAEEQAALGTVAPLVGTAPADPQHPPPVLGRVHAEPAPVGGPEERPAPVAGHAEPQPSPASSPVTRRELVQEAPRPTPPPAPTPASAQPAENVE